MTVAATTNGVAPRIARPAAGKLDERRMRACAEDVLGHADGTAAELVERLSEHWAAELPPEQIATCEDCGGQSDAAIDDCCPFCGSHDEPPWPSAADLAMRLGTSGPRILTGIAPLDEATRGGLPTGRVVVLTGGPGAGKTTLAINVARTALGAGVHVAVLAADEDAGGLLIRFGQLLGLDRRALEDGNPFAKTDLANKLRGLPLMLVDADDSGATIEEVSEELRRAAGDGPALLVVDSIQMARSSAEPEGDGVRARIDATVASLKRAAKVDGHLVIATSEAARGHYRTKKKEDRTSGIAASKESSSIEYAAAVLLALRAPDPEDGFDAAPVIEAVLAKNRLGRRGRFGLTLPDPVTARMTDAELDDDAAFDLGFGAASKAERFDGLKRRVLNELAQGEHRSASSVYRTLGGTKSDVLEAVRDLRAGGTVATVDGLLRPTTGDEPAEERDAS